MKFALVSRAKDPFAMCFAFFKAISKNKTPDILAEGMGRQIKRHSFMKESKYQKPSVYN